MVEDFKETTGEALSNQQGEAGRTFTNSQIQKEVLIQDNNGTDEAIQSEVEREKATNKRTSKSYIVSNFLQAYLYLIQRQTN